MTHVLQPGVSNHEWRILIGLSLVTFFAPTSSRDRRRWNVFTVYGIAPLAASPSTVAHPISLTSTTPYSVVPGEQPTESNAPLLVAPRPYFKVNRNFFRRDASWVVCLTRVNNQLPNNNHSHTCSGNVKLKVKFVWGKVRSKISCPVVFSMLPRVPKPAILITVRSVCGIWIRHHKLPLFNPSQGGGHFASC